MTQTHTKTHYEALGVTPDAADEVIKAAFRALSKTKHPDQGGNEDEYKAILTAYETLRMSRAEYDAELRRVPPPAPAPSSTGTSAPVTEDFVDADIVDEPWGTEVPLRTAPVVGDRPDVPSTHRPHRVVASFKAFWAQWAKWRLLTVAGLLALAVTLWFVAGHAEARGLPTLWVSIAILVPVIARVRDTELFSLALVGELAVVAGAALYTRGALEPFDYQMINQLLFALTVLALGEFARGGMMHRHRLKLVHEWNSLRATANSGGRIFWIQQAARFSGGRTTALLHDAETKKKQTRVLWGEWPAHVWVVVDPAGSVMASCSDAARKAWLATSGPRT